MRLDARDAEARRAGLPRAQQFAFAAQLQVLLGDAESRPRVSRMIDKPALRRLAERVLVEQHAGRRLRSPRPTRPRNWCNWARPKRSACSMTMIVASGTSTPTSIDGRGDEDARLAVLEGAHRLVLFRALHAAVDEADRGRRRPGSASAKRSSADISSISSDSSTSGQIQ